MRYTPARASVKNSFCWTSLPNRTHHPGMLNAVPHRPTHRQLSLPDRCVNFSTLLLKNLTLPTPPLVSWNPYTIWLLTIAQMKLTINSWPMYKFLAFESTSTIIFRGNFTPPSFHQAPVALHLYRCIYGFYPTSPPSRFIKIRAFVNSEKLSSHLCALNSYAPMVVATNLSINQLPCRLNTTDYVA